MIIKKLKSLLTLLIVISVVAGCVKEKRIEVQTPYVYDEEYYANLRAYKKTDHTLAFGWYAAYAPIEGASGYKDPASWGERILGIPDSMDIISLWMGIPSNDPESRGYAPIAYKDMHFVREKKGTRFVVPEITRMNKVITLKDGTQFDLAQNRNENGIITYAQYLVDQVLDAGLDGVDLDYEPLSGEYLTGNNFVKFVQHIAQYFGPKSDNPEKLLIIDFFSTAPPTGAGEYASYYIRQAYTQGFAEHNATRLQQYYNAVASAVPPSKFIVTENFGDHAENGGSPFTEANGNTLTAEGTRMYSLEGMARWNPTQGKKAGFGAFYFDRDYYSKTGIPYYNIRRAIQIANPPAK